MMQNCNGNENRNTNLAERRFWLQHGRYLHEVLPGDQAFRTQRVDQRADVFSVLVRAVQGAHHHLAQHLGQKVLRSLHLPHAVHRVGHVLTVQVLRHYGLLEEGERQKCDALLNISSIVAFILQTHPQMQPAATLQASR